MTGNFLVIRGERVDYAIAAELVREIVLPSDWKGPAPLRLTELLPANAFATTTSERLLLVQAGTSEVALGVASEIAFRQLDPAAVLALPPLLRPVQGRALVSAVAFAPDEPPLLVLDPAAFSPLV
jgi:hypothetical protein